MSPNRKFTISGPGAADFLTSPSGEDLPGTSPSKGMSQTRGDSITSDAPNPDPVRATGADDPTVQQPAQPSQKKKKRTTKKY